MGKKLTTEEFIARAKEVHGDKYDYSLVNYINNRTKIKIICKMHGVFEQTPNAHLANNGCYLCSDTKISQDEFINRSIEFHDTKYNYTLAKYVNAHTKIKIICPIHGIFEQTPNQHYKYGCKKCGSVSANIKQSTDIKDFIYISNKIHNNVYDYTKSNYVNNTTKVCIICPHHGEFYQQPNNHLNGQGCPKCGSKVKADKKRLTLDMFIHKSMSKFGSQFNYNDSVYISAKSPIKLYCNLCKNYIMIPPDTHYRTGCNKCLTKSIGELIIEKYLIHNNIQFSQQYKFENCKHIRKLPFDFYIHDKHICIEYDGKQHFKPNEFFGGIERFKYTQKMDRIKTKFCKDNGIKLVRIPYTEFDNIESILKSEL